MHVVPLDHEGPEHDGAGGLRGRVSADARPRREQQPDPRVRPRSADVHRSAAAPRDVPQAVPPGADAGVLLELPQGPPRRAGQQLPLVPRLQRLRQLAGVWRVRRGRSIVLLPGEAAEVRRLPHAARRLERSGGEERQGQVPPIRGRQYRAPVRQQGSRAAQGGPGFPARWTGLGRYFRDRPDARTIVRGRGGEDCGNRAARVEHLCGR